MPEGDSAFRTARHLHRALAGHTLVRAELRVPQFAAAQLNGLRVVNTESRGKHLLTRIGEHTLHTHLGMDGSWRVLPPRGTSVARRRGAVSWPAPHRIRVLLGTEAAVALGIDLARVALFPTHEEERRLGWLGPDLLSAAPDLDAARMRILADPERSITGALLDQGNVAGLGNEYVTEMCFLRGVHPHTSVAHAGDIGEWLELGRRLMLANRDRVDRVFTGNPREPDFVFGRDGQRCRRCGTALQAGEHASGTRRGRPVAGAGEIDTTRQSVWCPACQPLR